MSHSAVLGTSSLVGKAGKPEAVPEGKFLLLYFSAHWCPPCKAFTPLLAKYYEEVLKPRGDCEVVFVSSDRSEEDFTKYHAEHPWPALPYAERRLKESLSRKFGVDGIPTLVVLDKASGLITKDGREGVMADPTGFPWKPLSLAEIFQLGKPATRKDGSAVDLEGLSKLKDGWALYFSAHWCPPCRGFTPKLVSTYEKMKAAGKEVEVIFVSGDKDESQFKEYYGEMPWATFPFEDPRMEKLNSHFEVEGIPTLITFKGTEVVNKKARAAAAQDPEGAEFPWVPKPLPPSGPFVPKEEVMEAIQQSPCLLLNIAGAAANPEALKAFKEAADTYASKHQNKGPVKFFFIEGGSTELSEEKARQCEEGHDLAMTDRPRGWRCDRCGIAGAAPQSQACTKCDYDVCGSCLASRRGPSSPGVDLFTKVVAFLGQPEDEVKPTETYVVGVALFLKAWKKHTGGLTSAALISFAEEFGKECE